MSVTRCGWLAMLLGVAAFGLAQDKPAVQSAAQGSALSNSTVAQPQIVRVSFVEGDVRVSRGKDAEKETGAEWEQAAVDLPLENGYSLVTGVGRAEIEFEDASTAYLGENSVLVFNELSATGGVPYTELALLSGTMTLNVQPIVAGEWFSVRTPTDRFTVPYGNHSLVRINSYLDAMKLTPMGSTVFRVDKISAFQTNGGPVYTYKNGQRTTVEKPAVNEFADFDQWAIHRVMARSTAITATMKDAGLNQPVPGLAELAGQGHFYACPPYGTCWEPTNGFAGQVSEADKAAMAQQTVSVAALAKGGPKQAVPPANLQQQGRLVTTIDDFPCSPLRMMNQYQIDPLTGKRRLVNSQILPTGFGYGGFRYAGAAPYQWAVCHTGSWIHERGRYAWVAGVKRHHHWPVHWVKSGRAVGFVPIHPKDVAGKPPVGLKDGILHPVDKHGSAVERIAYAEGKPVTLLAETPKSFRIEGFAPLQRSEAPKAQAFALKDEMAGMKAHGTDVTFDHKSQSFMVSREMGPANSGNSKMMEPIGGRGSSLQAHAGGSSEMARGGGGSSAGSGGMSRGSSGASSSYSGGGGGASHASAPAASAPAASAPAASSGGGSSAASSGGGGKK